MKIRKNTAFLTCTAILLFLILSLGAQMSITAAAAGHEGITVRVGYYENEVFQIRRPVPDASGRRYRFPRGSCLAGGS